MKRCILLVEDEKIMKVTLEDILIQNGYDVKSLSNGLEAIDELKKRDYDLIITDVRLPGADGIEILKEAKKNSTAAVIIITAYGNIKDAVEAIKLGAYDYITKPFSIEEFLITVKKSLEYLQLKEENIRLKTNLSKFSCPVEIIGESQAMKDIFANIERIAQADSTVLIQGESGTGKELIATAIHYFSGRKDHPFIKINCAYFPEGLLESELFGYEKGAFTGAIKSKPGRFELADKGTIFLDEIGDMPLSLQAKLLRVLQEKSFERLGGIKTIKVDARIIAATHRNLLQEIKNNRFREDLYYRLSVIPIYIPPLRERKEDIPLLIEHFQKKLNKRYSKNVLFEKEVIEAMINYDYPGNVRELENIIERLIVMSEGNKKISIKDLPGYFSKAKEYIKLSLPDVIKDLEKDYILEALKISNGNKSKAAEILGISRKTLWQKIKEYGI